MRMLTSPTTREPGFWFRKHWLIAILAFAVFTALPNAAAAKPGSDLKVYVSLPLQGENAATSKLIVKGLRAGVRSVNGNVAGNRVRLVVLDDSSGARWQASLVRRNARKAVREGAVAYVGELNSEATAIARPILAKAGMPMFAPVSTAVSLTPPVRRMAANAKPVLFRSVPNDAAQARALTSYLTQSGVRRAVVIDDGQLYGKSLGSGVVRSARSRGVRIVKRLRANPDGHGRRQLVRRVAATRPQAVVFTGSQSSGAAGLFRSLNRAMPNALLFGGDALAHNSFARQVGPASAKVRLTRPAAHIDPRDRRYRRLLGKRPDSATVFAFDGMRAVLRAIRTSKAWEKPTVRRQRAAIRDDLFSGRLQTGAVSSWKVLPNGDSSNAVYDAIRLRGGRILEPIEVVALRRTIQRRNSRGLNRLSAAVWANISGDPALTTFKDLEALIEGLSNEGYWLPRVREMIRKTEEKLESDQRPIRQWSALNEQLSGLMAYWDHFPERDPRARGEGRQRNTSGDRVNLSIFVITTPPFNELHLGGPAPFDTDEVWARAERILQHPFFDEVARILRSRDHFLDGNPTVNMTPSTRLWSLGDLIQFQKVLQKELEKERKKAAKLSPQLLQTLQSLNNRKNQIMQHSGGNDRVTRAHIEKAEKDLRQVKMMQARLTEILTAWDWEGFNKGHRVQQIIDWHNDWPDQGSSPQKARDLQHAIDRLLLEAGTKIRHISHILDPDHPYNWPGSMVQEAREAMTGVINKKDNHLNMLRRIKASQK